MSKAKVQETPANAATPAEHQAADKELSCCTFLTGRCKRARYVTHRWRQLKQQFDVFVIGAAVIVVKILRGGKKWLLSNKGGAGYSHTGFLNLGVCARVCVILCVFLCVCVCLCVCSHVPLPMHNADALGNCACMYASARAGTGLPCVHTRSPPFLRVQPVFT